VQNSFKKYLAFVFITIIALSVEAQHFFVKNYVIEDGLPTRMINDVCQDKTGNMWFATYLGISKYDGFSFINFDNQKGLAEKSYKKIRCDEKGVLWAIPVTSAGQLISFDGVNFNTYSKFKKTDKYFYLTSFDVIYLNNKAVICVGTMSGIEVLENNIWTHFDISADNSKNFIYSVIANKNKFYISTNAGLCVIENNKINWDLNGKINPDNIPIYAVNFEDSKRADYRQKSTDKIWIISNKWLGCYENNQLNVVKNIVSPDFTDAGSTFLDIDDDQNIFWCNTHEKFLYNKKTASTHLLTPKNGFSSKGATSLFVDKESNVWITDNRGVDKIVNSNLINYSEANGMSQNEVTAIEEIADDQLVLGHDEGVSIFKNNKFEILNFPVNQYKSYRIMDLLKDNKGNIWIAANYLGLGKLEKNNKIKWYSHNQFDFATALFQDANGKIWLGTNKKLFFIKDEKIQEYKNNFKIDNNIRKIFAAPNGGIYITGLNGLWLINEDTVKKIPANNPQNSNNMFSYFKTKSGIELIGTMNGLFELKNGVIMKYLKDGINITSPVYFIFQDKTDNIWMGSNNGVYLYDGESNLKIFNSLTGLSGNETNRSAGMVDSKGKVWIGTDKGLSCFTNNFLKFETKAPVINFLYLEDSKGKQYLMNEKNDISFNSNSLSFSFRGLSFYNESMIQYKYKLEGIDKDWREASQNMIDKIKYYNLKPGKYVFCVKARNYSSEWSEVKKSEIITILQPFYYNWWFISITFVALIGIVLIFLKIRFEKTYNKLLIKEITERKLAEEDIKFKSEQLEKLNSEKDKFFSIIAHDLKSPFNAFLGLTEIMAEEINTLTLGDIKNIADRMKTSARKLFSLLENLLQWAKMQQGIYDFNPVFNNLSAVVEHNIDLYAESCKNKNLTIIENIDKSIEVESDLSMLNSIIRNLISNAVKFTKKGGKIEIYTEKINDNVLKISVKDSGIGMGKDLINKLFKISEQSSRTGTDGEASTGLGLILCKEFIEKHGSKLLIDSEEDKGSVFSFTLNYK